MSTRAIQFLKQHRVPFDVITYDHKEKGAEFAAQAIGFELEKTIKTLVVDLGMNQYGLALMPGDQQLSLKKLGKSFGVKKATMADEKTAERVTGYLVGGISPFGTKKRLKAVMEEALLGFKQVAINAGQRGFMLKMNPSDISNVLQCVISNISKRNPF